MHEPEAFLRNLALVMCVAAVTTVVFQRLKQPVVLGYLIAGLIIGPYVPIPLVADRAMIQTLSELGVILVMFSLGLEFSLRTLARVAPTAGLVAVIEVGLLLWLGYLTSRLFGWTVRESLFVGAAVSISSTTIIAKAFAQHPVAPRLRETVFGVLVVEDLIAILLLATLTAIAAGRGVSAEALAVIVGKLAAFLVGLLVVGLLTIPRFIRAVLALDRPETTLVASIGICFAVALLAQTFGYSVALGAFVAGSLVGESGEAKRIAHTIEPVRDMFGAIFFVAVGMQINPAVMVQEWVAILVLTGLVITGKVIGVSLGVFATGRGIRTALQSGMSLAQIGEFSFIIAGLGLSLSATREFLYPVAVAVSALTTLLTPWLIRASGPVASYVDRMLPHRLQTFAALYGSWVERLGQRPRTAHTRSRRLARLLLLDGACLAGTVIATSLWLADVSAILARTVNVTLPTARLLVIAAGVALGLPLVLGVVRLSRRLGMALAAEALPPTPDGQVDLSAAPRRLLVLALQLICIGLVGVPLLAITQPFLPLFQAAIALGVILVVLGFVFWRSAANLEGHVRAGSEVIVEALTKQSAGEVQARAPEPLRELLPGLGAPTFVPLEASSPAVGRSLSDLNLRGLTGATVLAIQREGAGLVVPTADEVLRTGDILAVAGTVEAIEAARAILVR